MFESILNLLWQMVREEFGIMQKCLRYTYSLKNSKIKTAGNNLNYCLASCHEKLNKLLETVNKTMKQG